MSTSRAAAGMHICFDGDTGVDVAYVALSPYLRGTIDNYLGASVSKLFAADVDGLSFSASTTAASLTGPFALRLRHTRKQG